MGLNTFFTDLDGTIICNQAPESFGCCVAVKNGKNTSFMNNDTYDRFVEVVRNVNVVAITTRCLKSYNNIYLKKFFKYAMVENGGLLVSDDEEESEKWLVESRKIVSEDKENFERIRSLIESYGYKEKWAGEEEFVLDYTVKEISEEDKAILKNELDKYENFLINMGKSSVIVTYKKLSKGAAVERFVKTFGVYPFITAGDNKEDESMFSHSDISIGKKNATHVLDTKDKLEFCDFVVNTVYDYVK